MNLLQVNFIIVVLSAGVTVACSSAAPKLADVDKASSASEPVATELFRTEPDRASDECAPGDVPCEEAATRERLGTLDRVEGECKSGRMPSCGFLYRSGPDGTNRLKAPGGPLRWFKERLELTSIERPEIKVSVFEGTPIFLVEKKGSEVVVSFPQIRFVDADGQAVAMRFKTTAASLSILPRKLTAPAGRGRRVSGFERPVSMKPDSAVFTQTECGPLFIQDDQKRGGRRMQQIYQLIDGAGISGWTGQPIDYDLGPCYANHALIFASDELTSDAVLIDENRTALAMEALWQKGFSFFEYRGEEGPCLKRTVEDAHSVVERSAVGEKRFRVERQGIHLMFFGPTVKTAGSRKPAFGDAELYTVLSISDDVLLIAPGAERGERIVAYRPEDARKWWRTEAACESYRAEHPPLSSASH